MIEYDFKPIVQGSFNLYNTEDIKFNESKEEILKNFKANYEKRIKDYLKNIGIEYNKIYYYSPKYYNFEGDGLTLVINNRINKDLYKLALLENEYFLNTELNKNISYDGYVSLSVNDISEEINKLNKPNFSPDCLILNCLINKAIIFNDFLINDYFIFEEDIKRIL